MKGDEIMSQNKDFDEYSNFDDRGLQSQSSATKSKDASQNTTKSNEEYGEEKNPLMEKIKNSNIIKKVEKLMKDNN